MTETSAIKVAMVTNIPAPYRIPVYERLAKRKGIDLCVFFCSGREPDREWDLQQAGYKQVYFAEKFFTYSGKFVHCNPDVWARLSEFKPDVIVTTGFNPTFLLAYVYARVHGAQHVAMTDGTHYTEFETLTWVHRLVRRWVYAGTKAFIGASQGSFQLYRSYGIDDRRMFQSHLCANNDAYEIDDAQPRPYDFVFSARFIGAKNPDFVLKVAAGVARMLGRQVKVLMMGSGELDSQLRDQAQSLAPEVLVSFPGFVKQGDLPEHYAQAKVMLFPTQIDTWGVVANEAFAAGVPVLVTPMAGVANDLVLDGQNGYVLNLDLDRWINAAVRLVSDQHLWQTMSHHARQHVRFYSYDNAAEGIDKAVRLARTGPQ